MGEGGAGWNRGDYAQGGCLDGICHKLYTDKIFFSSPFESTKKHKNYKQKNTSVTKQHKLYLNR